MLVLLGCVGFLSIRGVTNFIKSAAFLPPILDEFHSPHYIEANKQEKRKDEPIPKIPIKSNKPYLVIHVGPPKTGTTTLQDALFRMNEEGILAKDDYSYVKTSSEKMVSYKVMSLSCHMQLLKQRKAHNDDDSLSDSLRKVECWKETLEGLDPYLKSKTNLIFSAEPWSFQRMWMSTEEGYAMVDWTSLYLTLSHDWNLLLVFSYRRYPEWIFSAKQQIDQFKPAKPRLNKWPGRQGGKKLEFIDPLPSSRQSMPSISYRYSDSLLKEMQKYPEIPTAIFNMHNLERGGLCSTFVCDILENAPHACQYILKEEATGEGVKNPSQSLFYDFLAVAAYQSGVINGTIFKRHHVTVQIQKHHEETLQQGPFDFPLKCPPKSELDSFLNLSLSLEQEVVPGFAALTGVEEQHRSSFWKSVDRKKLCWIDTDAVLRNATWQDFFGRFF
jgi:hypothetical protein